MTTRSNSKKKAGKKKAAKKKVTKKKITKKKVTKKKASPATPTVEVMTPEMAKVILEKNDENRRVRKRTVEFYAQQMRDGEWEYNGETIKIRKDGVVIDGQHRLMACVQSGVSFTTAIVRDLPDVYETVDVLSPRNAGDALYRAHYQYASELASAARIIAAINDIEVGATIKNLNLGKKRSNKAVKQTVDEYHDHLIEGCRLVTHGDGKSLLRPKAVFIACYAMFASKNRVRAVEFFEGLTSGEILEKDDPAYRLRSLLMSALAQPHVRRKKKWLVAVCIKAWNAHLKGEKVRQLRFSEVENWPKIRARR
jgi:ParB-like chromosome segregation protein Spo0J